MLNIILSCLIIHYLLIFFLKPKLNSLYCGLFGYIGVPRKLDKQTFFTLGCVNDSRGGDSTGVFIDGKVEYGVDKLKLFSDFYDESELLKNTKIAKIALGHCRKASVGAINESTAQPVTIENDKGEIDFVLLHNGTLLNHKVLAAKYLKDTPDTFTDSQIMAYIMYYKGYEVLKEYEGAGAFVMVDYRKNRETPDVYMFKGESLQHAYSKETSEERPLYISIEDRSIWFSSMAQFLETLRWGDSLPDGIRTIKSNHLYHIQAGLIKSRIFLDRKDRHQTGATVYSYNSYERYERPAMANRNMGALPPSHMTPGATCSTFILNDYMTPPFMGNTRLIFIDGFYYINNKKAHGKLTLNNYGYQPVGFQTDYEDVWLYDGVLMYNEKCFNVVTKLCESFGADDPTDYVEGFPEVVYPYSPQLYWNPVDKKHVRWDKNLSILYTGSMGILFDQDDTEYNFTNGVMKSRSTYNFIQTTKRNMIAFKTKAKTFENIDEEAEIQKAYVLLGWFDNTNEN